MTRMGSGGRCVGAGAVRDDVGWGGEVWRGGVGGGFVGVPLCLWTELNR
jgi:hypothetical protein